MPKITGSQFMSETFKGYGVTHLVQTLLANKSYKPPVDRGRCKTIDSLVDEEKNGVMNGKGFFDWKNRSPDDLFKERNTKLIKLKKALRKIKPM